MLTPQKTRKPVQTLPPVEDSRFARSVRRAVKAGGKPKAPATFNSCI
jgi:hypothetical protein